MNTSNNFSHHHVMYHLWLQPVSIALSSPSIYEMFCLPERFEEVIRLTRRYGASLMMPNGGIHWPPISWCHCWPMTIQRDVVTFYVSIERHQRLIGLRFGGRFLFNEFFHSYITCERLQCLNTVNVGLKFRYI